MEALRYPPDENRSSCCSALEKLSVQEEAKEVSNCLLQVDPAVPA